MTPPAAAPAPLATAPTPPGLAPPATATTALDAVCPAGQAPEQGRTQRDRGEEPQHPGTQGQPGEEVAERGQVSGTRPPDPESGTARSLINLSLIHRLSISPHC